MNTAAPLPWNPLVCRGTTMPGNTLLMAKLCIVILATSDPLRFLRAPVEPLVPGLVTGWLPGGAVFCGIVFAAAAVALLCNQFVRASAAVAGLAALAVAFGSLPAFHAHHVAAGVLLVLCSLHAEKARPRLVRAFVLALLVLGAGAGLADPAWMSGSTLRSWEAAGLIHPWTGWLSGAMPWLPWWLPAAWAVVFGQLCLAVGFGLPNRSRLLVWTGLVLLAVSVVVLDDAAAAALGVTLTVGMLAFLDWPRQHLRVIWPRACGLPMWMRIALDKYDWDHRAEWPLPEDPDGILEVQIDERRYFGARAVTTLLLYSPVFSMAVFAALWLPLLVLPTSAAVVAQGMVAAPLFAVFIRPRYLQVRRRIARAVAERGR